MTEEFCTTAEVVEVPKPLPKISCSQCEHLLQRKFCAIKEIKVSRKKIHQCEVFEARTKKEPPKPIYVPSDYKEKAKKARSFMRRLQAIGGVINPDGTVVVGDIKITSDGQAFKRVAVDVPKTTATASVVGVEGTDSPQLSDSRLPEPGNE